MMSHTALAGLTVPIRCTSITAVKSFSSILPKLLSRRMPALAISTSMRPHLSMVCLTRCATPASSLTEAPLAMSSPPAAMISATTFSAAAELPPLPSSVPPRSLITTFAPSLASARACARPNPPPAPVTIATLSLKEMAMQNSRDVLMERSGWRWDAFRVKAAAKPLAQPRRDGQFDELRQQAAPQHADCDKAQRLQPPDQAGEGHAQHDRIGRRINALLQEADAQQPHGLSQIDGIGPFAQHLRQPGLQRPRHQAAV